MVREEALALLGSGEGGGAEKKSVEVDDREGSFVDDDDDDPLHSPTVFNREYVPTQLGRRIRTLRTAIHAQSLSTASLGRFVAIPTALGFALLPSFVQNRLRPPPAPPHAPKLHPTAFLDGIRGVAALLVFVCHLVYMCHDIAHSYGYDAGRMLLPGDVTPPHIGHHVHKLTGFSAILTLPIVRILYAGAPQVAYFFVVSGYALSYKPVKLMRARRWDELLAAQASGTFRRALRLYLPCVASTFVVFVLVRLGFYEWSRDLVDDKMVFWNGAEPHPLRWPSFWAQFRDWAAKLYRFVFHFTEFDYDIHLWTIPTEFKASMYLFVTHLGVALVKPRLRMLIVAGLIAVCFISCYWVMSLFYAGFLLCELDSARKTPSSPVLPSQHTTSRPVARADPRRRALLWSAFWLVNFVVSLYFSSEPFDGGPTTPGWVYLSSLIPRSWYGGNEIRFYTGIGAIQLVWAVSNAPFLQRIFDNRFSQYLGRISFALYLVHAFTIHTVGYSSMKFIWSFTGTRSTFARECGFAVAAIITTGAVFWAADLFTRAVDGPSLRFGKWLEGRVRAKSD